MFRSQRTLCGEEIQQGELIQSFEIRNLKMIFWLLFALANGLNDPYASNTFDCSEGVYLNLQESNNNYPKWIERTDWNPSESCNRQYMTPCECNDPYHDFVNQGTF